MPEPEDFDPLAALRRYVAGLEERSPPPEPLPGRRLPSGLEDTERRVRAQVEARRVGIGEATLPPWGVPAALPPLRLPTPAAPPRIDFRRTYALNELLAWHDEDFVFNAFRALLGRDPDPGGAAYHLARLRAGVERPQLLAEIAATDEGRQAGVRVEGLDASLRASRLARLPLVGRVLSVLRALWSLPTTVRRIEHLEMARARSDRETALALAALGEYASALGPHIERLLGSAVGKLERERAAHASLMAVIGRVASVQAELARLEEIVGRHGGNARLRELATLALEALSRLERIKADDAAVSRAVMQAERVSLIVQEIEGERRLTQEDNAVMDSLYVDFEDAFRGDRTRIMERVAVYVPLVHRVCTGPEARVFDIGCGRGEWLEVLRNEGVPAFGMDTNADMVARCRELGLDVVQGDGIGMLQSFAENSLGAVTAIHVMEHLPFARLIALMRAAHRALRPGGIAILETPNPENVIVGACNFWYDPTHQRPLPPEPTKRFAELSGFGRVEIMRLHPFPASEHLPVDGTDPLRDRLNHLFYGAQDYALVAYKEAP